MSTRRKNLHRRRPPREELITAFMPGGCIDDVDQLTQMRKRTHDGLIADLGNRRRSGITWLHYHGRAEVDSFLDGAYRDAFPDGIPADVEALLDQYRAFFAEHDTRAVLVVATCQAVQP